MPSRYPLRSRHGWLNSQDTRLRVLPGDSHLTSARPQVGSRDGAALERDSHQILRGLLVAPSLRARKRQRGLQPDFFAEPAYRCRPHDADYKAK